MVTVSYDEKSVIACRVQFSGLATGLLIANVLYEILQNRDN
jgi:hypothetical protein